MTKPTTIIRGLLAGTPKASAIHAHQTSNRQDRGEKNQRDWLRHLSALPKADVLDELASNERGLTQAEVDSSRAFYGSNVPVEVRRISPARRLLASFADPFTYILLAIAAISVVTDVVLVAPQDRNPMAPAIIAVMVLISGGMRFVQDTRSSNAADALGRMIETTANVQRAEAGRVEVPLEDVVVGDVVHLAAGDVVPADVRLLKAHDLFVSQASLTGESEALEKDAAPNADAATAPVTDLANVALMGSTVVSGTALAVVAAIGAHTLFGASTAALGKSREDTAFDQGINQTSRLLVRLMACVMPLVFLICGLTKGNWLDALLFSLSVAVGLTPEMLPMLVTTCLGKGAVDLSRRKVIVKRLDAIQDLGAIDVLCTDKTGTLTQNRVVLERHLDVMGRDNADVLRWAFINSYFETGLRNLIDSAIIRRAVEVAPDEGRVPSAEELTDRYFRVDELPFDYERRRVSVVVGDAAGRTLMITKGAIEEVLQVCATAELDGRALPLSAELRADVLARARDMANQGMRVLGVAKKADPAGAGTLTCADEKDMAFVGYLAFLDPPKDTAAAAVRALDALGIQTRVLTGDSAGVAVHVCRAIGIPVTGVLTGSEVEGMGDAELSERVRTTTVFAKLSPDQKARVVGLMRAQGHAVGYMGDGVNDAAAMRASDCGISVDSAVDVAREAADIILLEKDLMVLEHGIECGRRTYANMVKYVKMTVSSNFGNVFSVLVASVFLPFLPMTAVQLLLMNLMYDVTCTAIPWDNVDADLMRAPRRWDTASIRSFMLRIGPVSSVFDVVTFALLFFLVCPAVAGGAWGTLGAHGCELFAATFQAGWFVESMVTQTLVVHLIRTSRTPVLQSHACWQLTALGLAGIALAVLIPFTPMGEALGMAPLPTAYFALLALVAAGYVACVAVAKRLYLRSHETLL